MTQPKYQDNLERLERYWRRSPFHDELIHKLTALNKRVILAIGEMTLIVTGVTEMQRCEIPAMWETYRLTPLGDRFRRKRRLKRRLPVETHRAGA